VSKIILHKVLTGLSDQNIRFQSLRKLMYALDFQERIKGDHHIFTKDNVMEIINIQPLGNGKAKAYQVKQVRSIILKYRLNKEI
jgi:hypothetical protein